MIPSRARAHLLKSVVLSRIKYIRPNSVLAFRCGLLAKWLRVRVRVRAWARECTSCVFFFSSGIISLVNIFVFGGSVSARRITYEYSIDDVTATRIEVNLVSPILNTASLYVSSKNTYPQSKFG